MSALMLGDRGSKLLVVGFAAFLAAFTFLAATNFALISDAKWCASEEEHCLREWVSALSGWMAAGAAALAIGPLLNQVRQLRAQTTFILGDASPTLDAYSEGFTIVYLRLVNWNRRTYVIDSVASLEAKAIFVQEVLIEHKAAPEILYDDEPKFPRPIRVAAFDDRSKAPAICRIKLRVFGGDGVGPVAMKFTVSGRLLGERHAVTPLSAEAIVLTFASQTQAASAGDF